MATLETFLVLTLMCFLVPTTAETANPRYVPRVNSHHTHTTQPVFPFRLKSAAGQSDRCGYPGFELSCSNNQTIISTSSSGEFTVTSIDYTQQKFWVNDPENCMPGRYLANFTVDFPFQLDALYRLRNFTFVNCTANETYPSYYMTSFPCLGGPGYIVGALLGNYEYNSSCQVIGTVLVPSGSTQFEVPSFVENVKLSWDQPDCRSCPGYCCFKSRSSLETACFDINPRDHKKGLSSGATSRIVITSVLGFIVLSGLACHFSSKVTSQNVQQPNPNASITQPVPTDARVEPVGEQGGQSPPLSDKVS